MIYSLKIIAPAILYIMSLIFVILAMSGKSEWLLCLLIALLPVRNVYEKLQIFPMGKDLIDIFVIILLIVTVFKAAQNKDEGFARSPVNFLAIVLILYSFISLIQGSFYLNDYFLFKFSDIRVQEWKNYCILPVLYFITLNTVKDKKWVWRIVLLICLTMGFMNYYQLQQIIWFRYIESRDKIHGTFVYLGPNEVAAFYNQYTMVLMGIYFSMKKGWAKLLLLSLIVMNCICVLFLFSRAAYIGMAIGLFFLFLFKKRVLLIPLILIAAFWTAVLPQRVIERIEMTKDAYGELDKSSLERLRIWEGSLELFNESPITGVGYGVFRFMGYGLADTHNIYLKFLAEQGIIGLIIFLLLSWSLFHMGARLYATGDDDLSRGLGIGFAVCMVVLMINNAFGNRWTHLELSSNLWVFAALVARLNIISTASIKKSMGVAKGPN